MHSCWAGVTWGPSRCLDRLFRSSRGRDRVPGACPPTPGRPASAPAPSWALQAAGGLRQAAPRPQPRPQHLVALSGRRRCWWAPSHTLGGPAWPWGVTRGGCRRLLSWVLPAPRLPAPPGSLCLHPTAAARAQREAGCRRNQGAGNRLKNLPIKKGTMLIKIPRVRTSLRASQSPEAHVPTAWGFLRPHRSPTPTFAAWSPNSSRDGTERWGPRRVMRVLTGRGTRALCHGRTRGEAAVRTPGTEPSPGLKAAGTLHLGFPGGRTGRNAPPVCKASASAVRSRLGLVSQSAGHTWNPASPRTRGAAGQGAGLPPPSAPQTVLGGLAHGCLHDELLL